jgi:heme-degrading monooxygenase HmoA
MIGVLTHHWAKTDKIGEARMLLDRNGEAQNKAPGFVSRQTLIALADPAKITTLVVWTTDEVYGAWRASPQRATAMKGAEALWAKPPESERFQMVSQDC